MESAETLQKIISATKKTEEEVKGLVNVKMEKFSGLLTESGAALMVAKELGVELNLEQKTLERLEISQLKEGMNNVEALARVKQVFSPKKFEKNGKKGMLCSAIIADSTGEIRLTIWGRDVKKLDEEKVQRGTILLLQNCYVTAYKETPQLNLSYNGKMEVNPEGKGEELPKIDENLVKLAELKVRESDASVIARILRVFPETNFEKEGRKGRVANFMIGDEGAVIRATAWNDIVDELKKHPLGEAVKIEGAYTKDGMKGVELHLGFRARILSNPGGGNALPPASEMQARGIEFKEKKISELKEGDRYIRLGAEVAEIMPGKLRFNVCPKCGKKVDAMDGNYVCEACGEVEPDIRAVLGLRLKDDGGEIKAVLFAEVAEKAMGLSKDELAKRLEVNTAEQLIAELKETLVGKKITATGFPKMNSFSQELEFNAREISFQ